MAFEESDSNYEETASGESHQNDRMTIGCLGSWWCSRGVVLALGAALGVGGDGQEEHGCEQGNRC
jgi:hypothetical protein